MRDLNRTFRLENNPIILTEIRRVLMHIRHFESGSTADKCIDSLLF